MTINFFSLVVGCLAVWRISHLFHAEDGPFNILVRLRKLAGTSVFGELMDCFYCLSLWVAIPFALVLGAGVKDRVLLWLALSGGACLLERATSKETGKD